MEKNGGKILTQKASMSGTPIDQETLQVNVRLTVDSIDIVIIVLFDSSCDITDGGFQHFQILSRKF